MATISDIIIFYFFPSVVYFFHRRSAQIKKKVIFQKLIGAPKNLWSIYLSIPRWPFQFIQVAQYCRRKEIRHSATMLVFGCIFAAKGLQKGKGVQLVDQPTEGPKKCLING